MIRRPPRSTLFPTRRSSDLLLAPFDFPRGAATPTGSNSPPATPPEYVASVLSSRLRRPFRLPCTGDAATARLFLGESRASCRAALFSPQLPFSDGFTGAAPPST